MIGNYREIGRLTFNFKARFRSNRDFDARQRRVKRRFQNELITNLTFKDINLQDVDLSKNKGKIMVINFWATWCAPCKREMPSLEKLTFKYPEIKVFAVNTEKPNKIRTRDFFRSVGVTTLNTYYDPDLSLVKTFKLRGLPTSIMIDKNGEEFGRVIGEIDFASEDFLNLMKKYN